MTKVKTFYFIRHGESEANAARSSGKFRNTKEFLDPKLSSLGIEQAKKVGEFWEKSDLQVEHVCVSPLRRAYETANYIFKNQDVTCSIQSTIREVYWKDFENRTASIEATRSQFSSFELFEKLHEPSLAFIESGEDIYWQPLKEHETEHCRSHSFQAADRSLEVLFGLPYDSIAVVTHCCYLDSVVYVNANNCDVFKVQVKLENEKYVVASKEQIYSFDFSLEDEKIINGEENENVGDDDVLIDDDLFRNK